MRATVDRMETILTKLIKGVTHKYATAYEKIYINTHTPAMHHCPTRRTAYSTLKE